MDRFFSPFSELDALRLGIDQMFADLWPGFRGRSPVFLPGRSARGYPLINISAESDSYIMEAYAPGLDLGSLDVTVKRNTVTITGEKKPLSDIDPAAYHRSERSTGKFVRSYVLDCEINEADVKAEYKDGILAITLPKSEKEKPKKIAVTVK